MRRSESIAFVDHFARCKTDSRSTTTGKLIATAERSFGRHPAREPHMPTTTALQSSVAPLSTTAIVRALVRSVVVAGLFGTRVCLTPRFQLLSGCFFGERSGFDAIMCGFQFAIE